jgi:hypothetical protein
MKVIGWVDCWTAPYEHDEFTSVHKQALIECVKRRHYDFGHQDHQNLPYCAPFFDNGKSCALNKYQWDEVIKEAYTMLPRNKRLLPIDAIKDSPYKDILFENEKFKKEFLEGK